MQNAVKSVVKIAAAVDSIREAPFILAFGLGKNYKSMDCVLGTVVEIGVAVDPIRGSEGPLYFSG